MMYPPTYSKFNRFLFLLPVLLLLIATGCKRNSTYQPEAIALQAAEADNGVRLSWTRVNTSDFVRYEVFRSTEPIPDPMPGQPINAALLIHTISNADNNSFTDSVGFGSNYYRVRVVLKLRSLISPNIKSSTGIIESGAFQPFGVQFLPEVGNIYIYKSDGSFCIYNCQQNKITVRNIFLNANYWQAATNSNGEARVYSVTEPGKLSEFDGNDYSLIKFHNIPGLSWSNAFWINKGMLYYSPQFGLNDSLVMHSLDTDTRMNSQSCISSKKISGSQNGQFLMISSDVSTQVSGYILNPVAAPQLETTTSDPFYLHNWSGVSPLGNYIIGGVNGGVLLNRNFSLNGYLENTSFSQYSRFDFSDDEKYVLAQNTQFADLYRISDKKRAKRLTFLFSSFTQPETVIFQQKIYLLENTFDPLTGLNIISIRIKTLEP